MMSFVIRFDFVEVGGGKVFRRCKAAPMAAMLDKGRPVGRRGIVVAGVFHFAFQHLVLKPAAADRTIPVAHQDAPGEGWEKVVRDFFAIELVEGEVERLRVGIEKDF